jgi:hypothetical protein
MTLNSIIAHPVEGKLYESVGLLARWPVGVIRVSLPKSHNRQVECHEPNSEAREIFGDGAIRIHEFLSVHMKLFGYSR